MNKNDMNQFLKKRFLKWFNRVQEKGYSNEEAKMRDHFGLHREGSNRLAAFYAGYSMAIRENEKVIDRTRKNRLTCGIAYAAGILNQYQSLQAAEFILKESGMKSIKELRDAGCEEFDIQNIGDLLPEE